MHDILPHVIKQWEESNKYIKKKDSVITMVCNYFKIQVCCAIILITYVDFDKVFDNNINNIQDNENKEDNKDIKEENSTLINPIDECIICLVVKDCRKCQYDHHVCNFCVENLNNTNICIICSQKLL